MIKACYHSKVSKSVLIRSLEVKENTHWLIRASVLGINDLTASADAISDVTETILRSGEVKAALKVE